MTQSDGTATEYFSADGLGSVRQLTDSSGSILLNQTFDPYGNPYGSTGPGDTRFGFTGEQVDGNGLVYLRARYYQPEMGRFLNADPSRQERNPYQYAEGNPAINVDPSGLVSIDSAVTLTPITICKGKSLYKDSSGKVSAGVFTCTAFSTNMGGSGTGTITGTRTITTHGHWWTPNANQLVAISGSKGRVFVETQRFLGDWKDTALSDEGVTIVNLPITLDPDVGQALSFSDIAAASDISGGLLNVGNSLEYVTRPSGCIDNSCLVVHTSTVLNQNQGGGKWVPGNIPDGYPLVEFHDHTHALVPGSSGGGVYVAGKFVAVSWAVTLNVKQRSWWKFWEPQVYKDHAFAAILPTLHSYVTIDPATLAGVESYGSCN